MKGDPRVIDQLNRVLQAELTAAAQTWLHYRIQEDMGFGKLAEASKSESLEEMEHADKVVARLIFLGSIPNLSQLGEITTGETLREMMEANLKTNERDRLLMLEARSTCEEVGDYVSKSLVQSFIKDEEDHIDFLETQIDLHDRLGEERYALLNATPADKAEGKAKG